MENVQRSDRAGSSRDEFGRFCGMRLDGTLATPAPGTVGWCGPNCAHCADFRVYVEQDGVWCCAADFDYDRADSRAGATSVSSGSIGPN